MSYGNIKKSTAYEAEKMFKKFDQDEQGKDEKIVLKDGTLITGNPQAGAGQQPCPRQQEDAGLAQIGPYGSVGGGNLASQLAGQQPFLTFLYAASLNKGSMQSLATNPVI
jgi:hypothetical protein